MILRKMTKLKDGDKAVQDIVKNWKIMYSKRKAMMEELERLQEVVVMEKITAKEAMKELTMILMYLSRFEDDSTFNQDKDYYAWKGYDFDVINKLWDEDYIRQGKHPSRSKSVYITKNGEEYAKELMVKYGISDWK